MNIRHSKIFVLAGVLIMGAIGLAGCNSKSEDKDSSETDNKVVTLVADSLSSREIGEVKSFSDEEMELSEQNWKRVSYSSPYAEKSGAYSLDSIPMVYARFKTNQGPVNVYANQEKVIIESMLFKEVFSSITVNDNASEDYPINWNTSESKALHIVITEPLSYKRIVEMFNKGAFDIKVDKNKIQFSENGRGLECAIDNLLK